MIFQHINQIHVRKSSKVVSHVHMAPEQAFKQSHVINRKISSQQIKFSIISNLNLAQFQTQTSHDWNHYPLLHLFPKSENIVQSTRQLITFWKGFFFFPFSCTSSCSCSLSCISRILQVQIFSFSIISLCCTDQEFQWPKVFSSDGVCQGSHWLFWSPLCWRWWSLNLCLHLHQPPIIAWKVSSTLGSFSFLRSNMSRVCFGLLSLFRWRWKVIIGKSWSIPMSVPIKLRVLALLTLYRKRFLTRM